MAAQSLKRQRQGFVMNLEKIVSEINSAADVTKERLAFWKNQISLYNGQIEKLNERISRLLKDENEIEQENALVVELFDKFSVADSRLKVLSCSLDSESVVSSSVSTIAATASDSQGSYSVRLPKLQLKKFSGNELEWPEFIGMFDVSVHNNSQMPPIQKFVYLKSLLSGEAALCVANIDLNAANYVIAYDRLLARFGNVERQRNRLITKLVSFPNLDTKDLSVLRDNVDHIVATVRALEKLGLNQEQYGSVISPVIEAKLPLQWRHQWRREREVAGVSSFAGLLTFMEREIRIRQTAEVGVRDTSRSERSYKSPDNPAPAKARSAVPTASALAVMTNSWRSCIFCDGNHFPKSCKKDLSVADRWQLVRSTGACFKCGVRGHRQEKCFYRGVCSVCKGNHISLLCGRGNREPVRELAGASARGGEVKVSRSSTVSSCNSVSSAEHSIFLRTCAVRVNNLYIARVLCDTGCNRTFIKRDVVITSNIKVSSRKSMTITSFGGKATQGIFDVVQLKLHGVSTRAVIEIEAFVVDDPVGLLPSLPSVVVQKVLQRGFEPLADVCGEERSAVDIIIGEDVYDSVVRGPTQQIDDKLRATWTVFGWMIHGCTSEFSGGDVVVSNFCFSEKKNDLNCLWDLEHIGIADFNQSDFQTDAILSTMTRDIEGRYSVGLPWRSDLKPGRNYGVAVARLERLQRKLSQGECVLYDEVIKSMVAEGYAEEAPVVESVEKVCYLPHRPIFKVSNTTKTRMVLDPSASAKHDGLALNECLQQGPNYLPELFDVMLRFRTGRYFLLGDFEKAFWQIRVRESDRDALRFLWRESIFRMTCVPFGLVCSPAILQVVLHYHLGTIHRDSEVAKLLLKSLYVDDLITSVQEEVKAIQIWDEAVDIMADAKINLRKLRTNAPALLQRGVHESEPCQKVAGIMCNFQEDTIMPAFSFTEIVIPDLVTKRVLASILAKVYDPHGLICPFITGIKILLQDAWLRHKSWDEPLQPTDFNGNSSKDFEAIMEFKQVSSIANGLCVPRWVGFSGNEGVEMHVFCDASKRLYAACCYLLVASKDSTCCNLLAAKSRLVTPKLLEVNFGPKFELLGCFLAVKLCKSVLNALSETLRPVSVYCWTDSMICLSWIRGNPYHHDVFIRNRLLFIQEAKYNWKYIPTSDNPADIPTRGAQDLGSLWWFGPEWLIGGEGEWPCETLYSAVDSYSCVIDASSVVGSDDSALVFDKDIVHPKRVSKWRRLVRSLAWIRKLFCKDLPASLGELSVEEEQRGELIVMMQVQRAYFNSEVTDLSLKGRVNEKSRLYSLMPFLHEDGLIRVGGRLKHADIPFKEKHPVIVTRCGAIDLLVQSVHEKTCHSGAGTVLLELRHRGFWILQGRRAVRSIILKCRRCRRFSAGRACEVTPQFPKERLNYSKPFDVVGVDLGGPLILRNNKKVWFSVFTCFHTRAVHLELVSGLSEEAFGRALIRFVSRRGEPCKMWSDHGSNFVALSKWARQTGLGLTWKFIVERGPWWGGLWERLVGVVKSLLKKVLGKVVLTWEELETVLAKVECAVNKRPITFLYEDPTSDQPLALTPEMFLFGASVGEKRESSSKFTDILCKKFEWGQNMELLWRNQYLMGVLGEARRIWKHIRPIRRGEVVLVEDEFKKKQTWPLAVVEELFYGADGKARSARVRTTSGLLTRPIRKLYPLEAYSEESENGTPCESKVSLDVNNCVDSVPRLSGALTTTRSGRVVRPPHR